MTDTYHTSRPHTSDDELLLFTVILLFLLLLRRERLRVNCLGFVSATMMMDRGGERGGDDDEELEQALVSVNDLSPEDQELFKELVNRCSDALYGVEPPDILEYRDVEYEDYCNMEISHFERDPKYAKCILEDEEIYSEMRNHAEPEDDITSDHYWMWLHKEISPLWPDKDKRFLGDWEEDAMESVRGTYDLILEAPSVLARTLNEDGRPLIAFINLDTYCYESIGLTNSRKYVESYRKDRFDRFHEAFDRARLDIVQLLIDLYPPILHTKAITATPRSRLSDDSDGDPAEYILTSVVNYCDSLYRGGFIGSKFLYELARSHPSAFRTLPRDGTFVPTWPHYLWVDKVLFEDDGAVQFFKEFYGENDLSDLDLSHKLASKFAHCASSDACLELVKWLTTECPEIAMESPFYHKESLLHMLCKAQNSTSQRGSRAGAIAFMTQTFPAALHLQDVNGKTPLFVLCEGEEDDMSDSQYLVQNAALIALLIKTCPEATRIRSIVLPLDKLAPHSHITQVQDLIVSMSQALFPEIHLTGHSFADTIQPLVHFEIRMIRTMALLNKYQGLNSSSKVGTEYKDWAKSRFIAIKHKMEEVRGEAREHLDQ